MLLASTGHVPRWGSGDSDGTGSAACCELDIFVPAIEGCCGVTVPGRVLVLGKQPILVPLPDYGFGSELHVMPSMALLTTGHGFRHTRPSRGV